MSDAQKFIDYYEVLQVSPNCSPKMLESAYRQLAKMYHPDHSKTANVEQFKKVVEAYRFLRDASARAEYDARHRTRSVDEDSAPANPRSPLAEDNAASDADMHERILSILYRRRREKAQDAGLGNYHIQETVGCSDEHFEFHLWYLKSKGYIEMTEQGTMAITIDGVDHVISLSRAARTEKRLLTQLDLAD